MLSYNSGIRMHDAILLENTPLIYVHKQHRKSLNHQTGVQVCSQSSWNSPYNNLAIKENCSTDPNSRSRSSVSRPQKACLQALTCHSSI
ncbi:hypothetical protein TNCV_3586961 [Trichonephila clavipes]|nr:hypothetical protein TNCV_3586961 [Trichonephila clavipes]